MQHGEVRRAMAATSLRAGISAAPATTWIIALATLVMLLPSPTLHDLNKPSFTLVSAAALDVGDSSSSTRSATNCSEALHSLETLSASLAPDLQAQLSQTHALVHSLCQSPRQQPHEPQHNHQHNHQHAADPAVPHTRDDATGAVSSAAIAQKQQSRQWGRGKLPRDDRSLDEEDFKTAEQQQQWDAYLGFKEPKNAFRRAIGVSLDDAAAEEDIFVIKEQLLYSIQPTKLQEQGSRRRFRREASDDITPSVTTVCRFSDVLLHRPREGLPPSCLQPSTSNARMTLFLDVPFSPGEQEIARLVGIVSNYSSVQHLRITVAIRSWGAPVHWALRSASWPYILSCELLQAAGTFPSVLAADLFETFTRVKTITVAIPGTIFFKGTLGNLAALEELVLEGLEMPRLPGTFFNDSSLPALRRISLASNALTNLYPDFFAATTSLAELDLSGNRLSVLQPGVFNGLSNLQLLNMTKNVLFDVPSGALDTLTSLEVLDIDANFVTSISSSAFDALSSLRSLSMRSNELRDIPRLLLTATTQLQALNLEGNLIRDIAPRTFDHLSSLTHLVLSFNQLVSVDPALFSATTQLVDLQLSGNSLRALHPTLFSPLTQLRALHLDGNQLSSLPRDAFRTNHKLSMLTLGTNHLGPSLPHDVFHPLTNVLFLELAFNDLQKLHRDTFKTLTNVNIIGLTDNQLTVLDDHLLASTRNLTRFRAQRNLIDTIPQGFFNACRETLRRIYFHRNKLVYLPSDMFSDMPLLERVWVSFNLLTSIDARAFRGDRSLLDVRIEMNKITSLPLSLFDDAVSLQQLFAENNAFQSIPTGLFRNNSALELLDLSDSPDLVFNWEAIANKRKLRLLLLERIHAVVVDEASVLPLPELDQLGLELTRVDGLTPGILHLFPRLIYLTLGWGGLDEGVLPIEAICATFNQRFQVQFFSISQSSYRHIDVCRNVPISAVYLRNNTKLESVVAYTHGQVDVSGCVNLNSLIVESAPVLDISNTALPLLQSYCMEVGTLIFAASHMVDPTWSRNALSILQSCYRNAGVFDFSQNEWLNNIDLIDALTVEPIVLGTFSQEVLYAHTLNRVISRNSIPLFILAGTALTCSVEISIVELVNAAPTPGFRHECTCLPGHERLASGICKSTALSAAEVTGIVLGSTFGALSVAALLFGWRYYKKSREKYHLLRESEMKEKLFGEEVAALKKGWQIAFDELELVSKVDEGAFGEVWRAQWDGLTVAVKFVKYASLGMLDAGTLNDFDKELDFLRRTRHPHLVRFFGTGLDNHNAPFLVLEFVDLGSLRSLVRDTKGQLGLKVALENYHRDLKYEHMDMSNPNRRPLSSSSLSPASPSQGLFATVDGLKLSLILDIAKGMAFLHSLNVLHRDLKSGNVLITSRLTAKITDFGSMSGKIGHSKAHHPSLLEASNDARISNVGGGLLAKLRKSNPPSNESSLSYVPADGASIANALMYDPRSSDGTMGGAGEFTATVGVGTPLYMAPEALTFVCTGSKHTKISLKSDVFSFGVVLWEVHEERMPDLIEQELGAEYKGHILSALLGLYEKGCRLAFSPPQTGASEEAGPSLSGLYRQCVAYQPSERPPFPQIVSAMKALIARYLEQHRGP